MYKVYEPQVKTGNIYFGHPGKLPYLLYNHDVDIVGFKGTYYAAWNANENRGEDRPGQFNFLSTSDNFENWSNPVRLFTADGDCDNPIETDNQWQPIFINYHDRILFCSWCDFMAQKTYISTTTDGRRWRNHEVPTAPAALAGQVVGFPTNHGLLTSRDVMIMPCSLPYVAQRCVPRTTRYAGLLLSADGGETWEWSEPIEALSWTAIGENPADFHGDLLTIWEPAVFEHADGRLGLLIRNSTAQDIEEIKEIPHRMLLYAESSDQGRTWTKARPVEVDTICSRNLAVSGPGNGLFMVMNDNNVRVPAKIPMDRFFLALYCAPVPDPDLLLPGPVIQRPGGRGYYPNGYIEDGRLYVGYSYGSWIESSVIQPLPDFTAPFLLPRGGRPGLRIENDMAFMSQRQSSLGLVLTAALTRQTALNVSFDFNIDHYPGSPYTILTLGGKIRQGAMLRVVYDAGCGADLLQAKPSSGEWTTLGECRTKNWHRIQVTMDDAGFTMDLDGQARQFAGEKLLRKVCFGGLYEPPEWPMGTSFAHADIRIKLDSLEVR